MHRSLQSGMRENPASDRRHGSRSNFDTSPNSNSYAMANSALPKFSPGRNYLPLGGDSSATDVATPHAATVEEKRDNARLMTVHEVAGLLQVPASWVYGHTRLRCHNRIPGIRLGKYWRFQRTDIMHWIDANRRKDYPHAG
jgi:excisionase family DNA binding protein